MIVSFEVSKVISLLMLSVEFSVSIDILSPSEYFVLSLGTSGCTVGLVTFDFGVFYKLFWSFSVISPFVFSARCSTACNESYGYAYALSIPNILRFLYIHISITK